MRELWRATGLIVSDPGLRAKVSAAAEVEVWEDLRNDPALRLQPTLKALHAIDLAFQECDPPLRLAVYDLAEVNRWFLKDYVLGPDGQRGVKTERFSGVLAAYQSALGNVLDAPSQGLLEAVGVVVSDPVFRHRFGLGSAGLKEYGFEATAVEESRFRELMTPNSEAACKAEEIFGMGWDSTSSCLSRLLPSADYPHINR